MAMSEHYSKGYLRSWPPSAKRAKGSKPSLYDYDTNERKRTWILHMCCLHFPASVIIPCAVHRKLLSCACAFRSKKCLAVIPAFKCTLCLRPARITENPGSNFSNLAWPRILDWPAFSHLYLYRVPQTPIPHGSSSGVSDAKQGCCFAAEYHEPESLRRPIYNNHRTPDRTRNCSDPYPTWDISHSNYQSASKHRNHTGNFTQFSKRLHTNRLECWLIFYTD